MKKTMNRKEFLKKTTALGVGATLFPQMKIGSKAKKDIVKLGFIGTGLRGQWLLDLASKRDDVLIPAICDIDSEMIRRTLKILERNNKEEPEIYKDGDEDKILKHITDYLDAAEISYDPYDTEKKKQTAKKQVDIDF